MRGPYQGVLQILQYNRRHYVRAFAILAAVSVASLWLPPALRALLFAAALPAMLWLCSSLAVSHYIYDRSPLYQLDWLRRCLPEPPRCWVNIHAGLDETTHLLSAMFPAAEAHALDIYDPREMTEPSIAIARQMTESAVPATPSAWRSLPLADGSCDAVFLIFAAHELRRAEARACLFREAARVLDRRGRLVLVEHLRDVPNFLAFGPGFLHFFSAHAWRDAAAGLALEAGFRLTPFVRVFVFRRPS